MSNDVGGISYIIAGMGQNVVDESRVKFMVGEIGRLNDIYDTWDTWLEHRAKTVEIVNQLPTHYEFLKKTIYENS